MATKVFLDSSLDNLENIILLMDASTEGEIFRELAEQLKIHSKITPYIHEDSKTRKIIRELNWNIKEHVVHNHLAKTFRKKISKQLKEKILPI